MTAWVYNPPEPSGQPTGPGPFDAYAGGAVRNPYALMDLFTRGRCGNCKACPSMWRMEVPILPGNPYSSDYAGVVYFHRMNYQYQGVFTGYFQDKCSWTSVAEEPIYDANPYTGPFGDGWQLTFEYNNEAAGFTWSIYSPTEFATVGGDTGGSRWRCLGQFFCLGPNTFQHFDNGGGTYPFPYVPNTLTITPYWG